MAATTRFYRYALANALIDQSSPLWVDKQIVVRYFTSVGFERTMLSLTTDLAIPNRACKRLTLENGLLPITGKHMHELLAFTSANASEELHLLLTLGFFTGARIQTIAGLRMQTIERAVPDASAPGLWRLTVGPGASPPVPTKFGVDGQILIPAQLLDALKTYIYGVRRLKRQSIASPEDRCLVFPTRFGNC